MTLPDVLSVGKTHPLIEEILNKAGGGEKAAVGSVLEFLLGPGPLQAYLFMVHAIDGVTPFELETWTRGPIVTSLCEVEDTIFLIHQSPAGDAEMPYEPRLMPPEFRPKIDLFRMIQPGGEGLRFMLAYALVEAQNRVVKGLRGFTWSPDMSRHFARLYTEKATQPEVMDRGLYLQKMQRIAERMTIKDVLDKKLARSRSDGSSFIPFIKFN